MSEEKIGIKIADGTYFPVLEENSSKRKRLILTTVNDNQSNVQIDLYKGEGDEFLNPSYVGSLTIDSIAPAEKGTPEIELKIGMNDENVLDAVAKDLASGTEESLSVSVASLPDESTYDVPEFSLDEDLDEDFDEDENLDESLSLDEEDFDEDLSAGEYSDKHIGEQEIPDNEEFDHEETDRIQDKQKRRFHPVLTALLVLVSLLLLAGLVYFLYNSFSGKEAPSLQAEKKGTTPAVTAPPAPQKKAPVTAAAPVAAVKTPVVSEAKKTDVNDKGVWYRIRWGDTLWGISYSFYSSPKLYAKIAKENKIKNPDLIFAETKIFIPKE